MAKKKRRSAKNNQLLTIAAIGVGLYLLTRNKTAAQELQPVDQVTPGTGPRIRGLLSKYINSGRIFISKSV